MRDGEIVAAAQEERFSREKHDERFPIRAIRYCLEEGGVTGKGLDAVVFYDKPVRKFARLLEMYFSVAPRGFRSFIASMPAWLKKKLWVPLQIDKGLETCGVGMPAELLFTEHHEAHAASAFYPSPFERAAILSVDGVGERATAALGRGAGSEIELLKELHFPHSLGLLYSAFTCFCGFEVNDGEYKLMGLAPYGEPRYVKTIYEKLVDVRDDGSLRLNMEYFGYLDSLRMTSRKFERLFGGPPRRPDAEITQRETDLARSVQVVTEEILLRMASHLHEITGEANLCLAGGVALNCVANGRLLRESPFSDIWIQPAAGDAGGAIGAALMAWYQVRGRPRTAGRGRDAMKGAFLGPGVDERKAKEFLDAQCCAYRRLSSEEWGATIAELLRDGKTVGVCAGRMEFGPRALGNRSILADARLPGMQSLINRKVKLRESFRPFAPACLEERAGDYFELDRPSPYMLLAAPVKAGRRRRVEVVPGASPEDRAVQVRSDIPAVTHVDYTARIQTVDRERNPGLHGILSAFERLTGCGVLLNTSFNMRDEPIVCTAEDAYRCFRRAGLDCLILGPFLIGAEGSAGGLRVIDGADLKDDGRGAAG